MQRARPIVRKRGLDAAEFVREHLDDGGMPVVVGDALDAWPARTRWTFEFFREHYGDDKVIANRPMFLEPDLGLAPVQARMRLADYIDYIEDTRRAPRAHYTVGDLDALRRDRVPLYAPIYRVLDLHLNADGTAVDQVEVLLRADPRFDEPTLSTIAADVLLVVADSHWNRFDAEGGLPPAEELSGPTILAVPIDR